MKRVRRVDACIARARPFARPIPEHVRALVHQVWRAATRREAAGPRAGGPRRRAGQKSRREGPQLEVRPQVAPGQGTGAARGGLRGGGRRGAGPGQLC
jgi:hypothetical protein